MPEKKPVSVDIFDLLSCSGDEAPKETSKEAQTKTQREELLATTKVKDLYPEGSIAINKYTCVGGQCKLCIKVCPTNALYWTNEGIGVVEDLCVHCEACVMCCMVNNCIKVSRKRPDGKTEQFSSVRDITVLNQAANSMKRRERVGKVYRGVEDYCDRHVLK